MKPIAGKEFQFSRLTPSFLVAGWVLLVAGAFLANRNEPMGGLRLTGVAFFLSVLLAAFLTIMVPRLGCVHQWRTLVSSLLVLATSFIVLARTLNNHGNWTAAKIFHWIIDSLAKVTSKVVGQPLAEGLSNPLVLMIGAILIFAFAMKRAGGFYLVFGLLFLYGCYPFDPFLFSGTLLWLGGLALLIRSHVHLPVPVLERLPALSECDEEFLTELRERPISEREAIHLLVRGQDCDRSPESMAREIEGKIRALSHERLIRYNPEIRSIVAGDRLVNSYLPPGVKSIVNAFSWGATGVLLVLAVVYLTIPFDVMPEFFLGPIGLIDDMLFWVIACLPLGERISVLIQRFGGRKKPQSQSTEMVLR